MAGKTKQGGAEGLMDLVAMLPWWGGVALALVSYAVLHQVAMAPKPALPAMLAFYGQVVVPVICLAAALLSFLERQRRESLVHDATQTGSADALNGMSWREFDILVGEAFRLRGYKVRPGGPQGDGGIDLVLRKDGETFLVQCKQWKAFKVGVEVVRELFGVMAANGATGGFVVTSGTFTHGAEGFAHGRNVTLVDGPQLLDMLRQARRSLDESAPSTLPADVSG